MPLLYGSVSLTLIVVFVAFFIWLYFYFTRNFDFWVKLGIPYVKPVPFLGNLKDVMLQRIDIAHHLKNLCDAHKVKAYLGIFAFDKPALIVNDLDLVKKIVAQDSQKFIDRIIDVNADIDPVFGLGIFSLKGRKWKHIRMNLSPAFTSGKMKMMFYLVENCGKELVRCLDAHRDSPVMVRETMARYTTDAISTCALGIESNSLKNPDAEVRQQMRRVFDHTVRKGIAVLFMFFAPALQNFFLLNFVEHETARFFRSTVWSTVQYREKHGVVRRDLLDSLMELRKRGLEGIGSEQDTKFDGDLFVAQAFHIFIGGFETSSSTTTFALHQLAFHPEIQKRLREEIKANLAKHNQEVTYDGTKEMAYLDMVVSGKRFGLMQVKTALTHILSKFEVEPCKDTPRYPTYDPKSFLLLTRDDIQLKFKRIED
ncbi:cytochrome P450 6j1-like isoform X2 [Periplaneta americana]|uniref:cytochrome P450 6j1-like isoform X2 n=1 Tax=Periplaneta americana TaxID=6978 RepID=UPI0037E863E5